VDVKSTVSARRAEFERSIFTFGYFRQGSHYLASARARRLPARHFSIIACEKTPPYAVGVYRLTEGAIQAGDDQIRPLLRRYAECMESGDFPGYPDEVIDVSLPDYAWRQIEEQAAEIAA
jgi:hypothetical protein